MKICITTHINTIKHHNLFYQFIFFFPTFVHMLSYLCIGLFLGVVFSKKGTVLYRRLERLPADYVLVMS